ncbi:PTS sugar transporter subunit IIB [Thorsellia anophelis]|uniref:PTS system, cellobiose-specific IIB component n=1 Tax=Thorsellia anophelis DSM 18579 TaxID=1123402 RepID=A0A1I0F6V8_9GAMM|nr:PTS sugar transporter subunit IIB [Thorsellia anophelis]SET53701.1 PTS system, cellobiose-specific IIB component [Thorsellia anophelis DSM 18579]
MKKITIMLVCGGGASSGFLAQSMRKSAHNKSIEAEVFARSETEINHYIDEIDVLLIGPHLSYLEEDILERVKGKNIKVSVIDNFVYSTLNGDKAIEAVLTLLGD